MECTLCKQQIKNYTPEFNQLEINGNLWLQMLPIVAQKWEYG